MPAAHHLSKLRPPKAATSRAQSKEGFAFEALRAQELMLLKVLVNLTPMGFQPVQFDFTSNLRQNTFNDGSVHIGQAVVATLELIGEAFVIDSEQVEKRRLEVVHMYWIVNRIDGEVV
jgi:hypothetical protein